MARGCLCRREETAMTLDERESIIDQLALARGMSKSVFEKHTDEELLEEMRFLYSDEEG